MTTIVNVITCGRPFHFLVPFTAVLERQAFEPAAARAAHDEAAAAA